MEYRPTLVAEALCLHGRALEMQYADDIGSRHSHVSDLRGRAAFDLARLALAARIAVLQGRPRPTREKDLVPEYFPAPPLDPFTGKAYLYDATRELFYSPGPDGIDDHLAERADLRLMDAAARGDDWLPVDYDEVMKHLNGD